MFDLSKASYAFRIDINLRRDELIHAPARPSFIGTSAGAVHGEFKPVFDPSCSMDNILRLCLEESAFSAAIARPNPTVFLLNQVVELFPRDPNIVHTVDDPS